MNHPPMRSSLADSFLLTRHLLRIRMLAARRDWSNRKLYLLAGTASLMLVLMIFFGTYVGTRVLTAAHATGLLTTIPAWAFLVYLFTDIFIAFGQALNDLYLSRDTPLLLSIPIRLPSIVTAKFVLGVAQNEVYVAIFLLPFVLGYLAGVGASPASFILALAGLALFPATLYAVLVVVTIAVLRYVSARFAKEALWLIGASVPTVFWIASFASVATIKGDVTSLHLPAPPAWLPSTWLGNAVSSLASGSFGPALQWLALLAAVTLIGCPIALAIVSRAYARGLDPSVRAKNVAVGLAPTVRAKLGSEAAHPPILSLILKDALTFARSPQLWFNHIAALGFVVYLLVGHSVQSPLLPLTTQLAMIQIGFVAVLDALNPGMTALSIEHGGVWLLKAVPLRPRDVLVAKAVVAYGQTAAISLLAAVVLSVGYHFSYIRGGAVVIFALLIAAAAVGCGISFDTAYPCFDWENPNHINRGVRLVLPFLKGLGILALCGIVLGLARSAYGGLPALIIGLTGCVLITGLIALRTLRSSIANFAALEV